MKLHKHQQDMVDSVMRELDEKYGGKTVIMRSMLPQSGKHIKFMQAQHGYNTNFERNTQSELCWADEITVYDDMSIDERIAEFRPIYPRGAAKPNVDIAAFIRDFIPEREIYARHPVLMTMDYWKRMTLIDVFKKAVHTHNAPHTTHFNELLTIYWHNYYMDDLQGTFDRSTLHLLTNGYKVAAYGLFNTLPRLSYVRACIAKAIVFGGNDDASAAN